MKLSPQGLEMIKSHEGLVLESYPDPGTGGEPYTIGYGSTTDVRPGMRITQQQAEQRLRDDVARFERAVGRLVTVPLNQSQFDALVSFAFNVGSGALASSTLLRKLNGGDYSGAAVEFERWVFAGGRKLPGLESRRREERELFEAPDDKPLHWYGEVETGKVR